MPVGMNILTAAMGGGSPLSMISGLTGNKNSSSSGGSLLNTGMSLISGVGGKKSGNNDFLSLGTTLASQMFDQKRPNQTTGGSGFSSLIGSSMSHFMGGSESQFVPAPAPPSSQHHHAHGSASQYGGNGNPPRYNYSNNAHLYLVESGV